MLCLFKIRILSSGSNSRLHQARSEMSTTSRHSNNSAEARTRTSNPRNKLLASICSTVHPSWRRILNSSDMQASLSSFTRPSKTQSISDHQVVVLGRLLRTKQGLRCFRLMSVKIRKQGLECRKRAQYPNISIQMGWSVTPNLPFRC